MDDSEPDDEHVSVAVRVPSGWSVGAYVSGLVIFENVENLEIAPRHMRVDARAAAEGLLVLLAMGDLAELERLPWLPGNGAETRA